MSRIDTASELRVAWTTIATSLRRDLALAGRLADDPLGTLNRLGYEVGPEAARLLLRALPS
ncbi:MAG: hypothetical protein H6744_11675 [Deltaproteobacteria bacterium]|nr:hypothetical protein [Deltaproteobacteria bacterium]MCB9787336.1 hypothetical protein [Deltaproteobacteria bacterium]